MNFYKHHIGDYDQATRHLSFAEDGAYCRLIRKYYAEESPLPVEIKKILRLIGARTKEEKAAVEAVLEEFFELRDDGWHNTRCDTELEAAWAKASKNREVGKLGGRPRKSETQTEPTNNPNGSLFETQTVSENNPSQTPDTRHQTPDLKPEDRHHHASSIGEPVVGDPTDFDPPLYGAPLPPREDLPPPEGDNQPAIALVKPLRKWGVNAVFTNPHVQDWAKDPRVTLDILAAAVAEAREYKGNANIAPGYLVPIVDRLLNPPAKTEAAPGKPREDNSWAASDSGITAKARELKIKVLPMHSYADVKRMCFDEIRKRKGA